MSECHCKESKPDYCCLHDECHEWADKIGIENRQLHARAEKAERERDEVRAEATNDVMATSEMALKAERERDEARAALRKIAARYDLSGDDAANIAREILEAGDE